MLQFLYKRLRYSNILVPAGNNLNLKFNFAYTFISMTDIYLKTSKYLCMQNDIRKSE
jgi:hypothetical protein